MNEVLIIFFLLLLNAFFALSEMAIVSSSKPLLRQHAKGGKRGAQTALNLAENSGRFLSTVQVGITLVGILAGAYGGATIAEKLTEPFNAVPFIAPHGESVAVFLVVTMLTYFSVVIGELVPKQLALGNPEKLAMFVAWPMTILSKLCTPIVLLLEGSATFILTMLRIQPKSEGMTETEITAVIAEGVISGAIEGEEHDVIRRVIRLGDRDVKSIMTHHIDVKFIDIHDDLPTVRDKIAEAGHSRYPVVDGDASRILGIVKAKRILNAAEENFRVADFLHDIVYFTDMTTCLDALKTFRSKGLHIAAVVDEYGTFEGIFTTSDLLEAIVGVMPSNYDNHDGPLIVARSDGSWLVDGLTPIDEIQTKLGLEGLEANPDYHTVAGFVFDRLQTNPTAGQSFAFSDHVFEIVDMDRHRIDKILIRRQVA